MINKIIRGILSILGAVSGLLLYNSIIHDFFFNIKDNFVFYILGIIISFILGGTLLFIISPWVMKKGNDIVNWVENELSNVPLTSVFIGSVGLIVGLIIAYLISNLINIIPIPYIGSILSTIVYIFMAYLGVKIATKKTEELPNIQSIQNLFKKNIIREKDIRKDDMRSPKVLDTSVIIDGRIADICKTGFIEGPLIIPEFILAELRHIADSSVAIKRNRGRRGLDILNKIQKELDIEVIIEETSFDDVAEVDIKLLKLAQHLGGKVVTNDYNLNKVAEFQGVPVLNINELANAVKPVVLPGEEMFVQVIKDGKESGQGLAYLDDGTMIVVEDGKKYIGQDIDVLVTSVLQTAAGRMIFAKPKSSEDKSA